MPVTLTQSLLDSLLAEANSAISHPPIQYVGVDPRVLVTLCEIAGVATRFTKEKPESIGQTGFIYLASPYSHDQPAVRKTRYELARDITGKLIQIGHVVFAPIVYSHQFAESHGTEFGRWKFFDLAMIDAASELIVLMIDGWETSKGVWAEVEHAKQIGKPVRYLDPVTMEARP